MPSSSGENLWKVSLHFEKLQRRAHLTINAGEVEDKETSIEGDDSVTNDDPVEREDQEEETALPGEREEVDGAGEKLRLKRE